MTDLLSPNEVRDREGLPRVSVGQEELVYRPDAGDEDPHFFRDLLRWSKHRDAKAGSRLEHHRAQMLGREVRDVASAAFGAQIVPQFLDSFAAGPVRAGDPLLAALNKYPIPPKGLLMQVPRAVTTSGSSAHAQTSQNTAVSETDPSLVNLDVLGRVVATIAGQVTIASQVLDRSPSMASKFIARDLQEAVTDRLDEQLINGTGINGQLIGLRNVTAPSTVTWNDATATRGEFVYNVSHAAHDLAVARRRPPDLVVMNPRRWYWLTAALASSTSDDRSTLVTKQVCAGYEEDAENPYVGSIVGLPVVLDANVPSTFSTNEDVVLVIRSADMPVHLSPIQVDVMTQIDTGTALEATFVAYQYAIWWPDRYRGTSTAILTGTGLVTPVWV